MKIKLTTIFWRIFLYPSRFSVRLPCKKAPTSTETTTSKPSHKPCWSFSDLPPVRHGKKSCCLAKKTHQLFVMTYRTMPVARTGVVLTSHIPISSPFSWYVSIDFFKGLLFLKMWLYHRVILKGGFFFRKYDSFFKSPNLKKKNIPKNYPKLEI